MLDFPHFVLVRGEATSVCSFFASVVNKCEKGTHAFINTDRILNIDIKESTIMLSL